MKINAIVYSMKVSKSKVFFVQQLCFLYKVCLTKILARGLQRVQVVRVVINYLVRLMVLCLEEMGVVMEMILNVRENLVEELVETHLPQKKWV